MVYRPPCTRLDCLKWPAVDGINRSNKPHKRRLFMCISHLAADVVHRWWSSICCVFTIRVFALALDVGDTANRLPIKHSFPFRDALNLFQTKNEKKKNLLHRYLRIRWLSLTKRNICGLFFSFFFFSRLDHFIYFIINAIYFPLSTDIHEECIERTVLGITSSCALRRNHNYFAE